MDLLTCYFRYKQMKDVFARLGVEVNQENKKEIDKTIHSIVGVEYKDCSLTWKIIKGHLAEDEEGFMEKLKNASLFNLPT
ncbi:MAG: hypothetical protein PVJ38_05515 [Candidatus Bathyarchaeota archaeon]